MRSSVPRSLTGVMAVSGLVALWGLDQAIFWVGAPFKVLTTLLLFGVLGAVDVPLRRKVALGLVFSVIGDIALLGKGGLWFQLGLAAFLVTHLLYVAAFFPFTVRSLRPWVTAILGLCASATTVSLAYPVASKAGVAVPVAIYAAVLTATLVTANATVGGPLVRSRWAALGALLFYIADTSIAVKSFVPTIVIPHPVLLTTGLYWVGQYLLVATARAGTDGDRVGLARVS